MRKIKYFVEVLSGDKWRDIFHSFKDKREVFTFATKLSKDSKVRVREVIEIIHEIGCKEIANE